MNNSFAIPMVLLVVASCAPLGNIGNWDEERDAAIISLTGPPKGIVGKQHPITSEVRADYFTDNRGISLEVDEASKQVVVRVREVVHHSLQPRIVPTVVLPNVRQGVLFTPMSPGQYQVRPASGSAAPLTIQVAQDGTTESDWWVSEYAYIRKLTGPATATVGVPVTVTAWVELGPESCARLESVTADVAPNGRFVFIKTMRALKKSPLPLDCGDEQLPLAVPVTFTPVATGSCQVESFYNGPAPASGHIVRTTLEVLKP